MFNVIVDTRERTPWSIETSSVGEVFRQKLDTGDYSIQGLENLLCIERKKNVAELATNISQPRFWDEMKRMKKYEYRYLILEFSIDDVRTFPVGSDVPESRWETLKVKGPYIMKKISEIQVDYNIDVVFCGDVDNARWVATNIMKRVHERHKSD